MSRRLPGIQSIEGAEREGYEEGRSSKSIKRYGKAS